MKDPISEQDIFESAKSFLEQEFGVPVHIVEAEGAAILKALDCSAVQACDCD